MLDFICVVFAVLWATGSKRKIQNENMCRSYHKAIGIANGMLLKRLHYVFTISLHTCDNASMKLLMEWFVHTTFCQQ